jgi:hypothetical protein
MIRVLCSVFFLTSTVCMAQQNPSQAIVQPQPNNIDAKPNQKPALGNNTPGVGNQTKGYGKQVTGYGVANTQGMTQPRPCGAYPPDPLQKCP